MNPLFSRAVRGAAVIAAIALATSQAPAADSGRSIVTADLDRTCPACKDFYQFAAGGWLKRNPVPPEYSSWSSDYVIFEKTRTTLRGILEEAGKRADAGDADEDTRKIGLYYRSCMDTAAIDAAGTHPIDEGLATIATIADRGGVAKAAGQINAAGGNALLSFGSAQDLRDSRRVVGEFDQGGLGLPDRDYYTRTDAKSRTMVRQYRTMIAKQFQNLGDTPAAAARAAAAVVAVETQLAKAQLTNVQLRDPKAQDHPMSRAALQRLAPNFDFETYLKAVGAPPIANLNVGMPAYLSALSADLDRTSLASWKSYLRWQLVAASANELPLRFERTAFDFYGIVLRGQKKQLPRWKRCVAATDGAIGEAVGRAYVAVAFPPAAKERALALVDNLQATLRDDLGTNPWLSAASRERALAKLKLIAKKIGYPDRWRDYGAMHVEAQPFASNAIEARRFEATRQLAKIGKPVDRGEWGMTPATVNAYYSSQLNEIVFPAGILQPPYFSLDADDASNYGEAGATIGHEMTHGFDDEGRLFDGYGNLRDWWTPADAKAWTARTQCIVDQANRYVVVDGIHLNGKLVSGEATADLGGITIAYHAFERAQAKQPRRIIGGFTPEQRFFIAYAQSWETNYTPQTARYLAQADPHPVAAYRVNGTLADMPEFAAAFGCKAKDAMVPARRCAVW